MTLDVANNFPFVAIDAFQNTHIIYNSSSFLVVLNLVNCLKQTKILETNTQLLQCVDCCKPHI